MVKEADIPEFEKLISNYREAIVFPIESILNTEKNTATAMSKIAELEIAQIIQNSYRRLSEVEDFFRSIVCEELIEQKVEKARETSKVIVPVGWLANELNSETSSITSLIGSYIEISIDLNGIIKNSSGLSAFFKNLLNGGDRPEKFVLSNFFCESSAKTNLKKLGNRLDAVGIQLYIQINSSISKICSLAADKWELEVDGLPEKRVYVKNNEVG